VLTNVRSHKAKLRRPPPGVCRCVGASVCRCVGVSVCRCVSVCLRLSRCDSVCVMKANVCMAMTVARRWWWWWCGCRLADGYARRLRARLRL
jgi:hypothetical protein